MAIQQKVQKILENEFSKLSKEQNIRLLRLVKGAKEISAEVAASPKAKILKFKKLIDSSDSKHFYEELLGKLETLWDKLSWAQRLSVGGLSIGLITSGTSAAGIAAFGTAVGIPVALLSASGGALLGMIIESIEAVLSKEDKDK